MQIYKVGGCVRDALLGIKPKDIDYVIVGATPSEITWPLVGKDFPVYLGPDGCEYALARKERSTGPGYSDFTVDTNFEELEELIRLHKEKLNSSTKEV